MASADEETTIKTVVVENDVHKAISVLADEQEQTIQQTVDDLLRDDADVQETLGYLRKRDAI